MCSRYCFVKHMHWKCWVMNIWYFIYSNRFVSYANAINNQRYSINSLKHVHVIDSQQYLIGSIVDKIVIDNQIIMVMGGYYASLTEIQTICCQQSITIMALDINKHLLSWRCHTVHIIGILSGESLVSGGFSMQRSIKVETWCLFISSIKAHHQWPFVRESPGYQ